MILRRRNNAFKIPYKPWGTLMNLEPFSHFSCKMARTLLGNTLLRDAESHPSGNIKKIFDIISSLMPCSCLFVTGEGDYSTCLASNAPTLHSMMELDPLDPLCICTPKTALQKKSPLRLSTAAPWRCSSIFSSCLEFFLIHLQQFVESVVLGVAGG